MIKIGAIDSLTRDRVIHLKDCENITAFLQREDIKSRLSHNDKIIISEAEYHEFSKLIETTLVQEHIGGSAFNTCATIAAALPATNISFITPPSTNKNALKPIPNLRFLPADPPDADKVISRVSFICLDERGNKQVLKYLGNIYEYLSANLTYVQTLKSALEEVISTSKLFILPGGITKKFPLEIFEHALQLAEKYKTKLVFPLPTHSDFTPEEITQYDNAFRQAAIILGNADELKNTKLLASELRNLPAVSLITNGGGYTYVISNARATNITPVPLRQKPVSLTGAGDAAYAGFLCGLLSGYTIADAANLGMKFAHEVLKIPEARLPSEVLKKIL